MPVRRVILARRALRDLNSIFDYISGQTSDETAGNVIAEILDAIERLSEMARNGSQASGARGQISSLAGVPIPDYLPAR